ncbi:MAG: hypothetical protein HY738_20075 [Bacteroidia bacterium]|nr:hypothetical protein [Bacteroidia bacterium]
MKPQASLTLNIWDILQLKIWDKICNLKGYSEDFTFGPVYENNYEFELTCEELNKLGIKPGNRYLMKRFFSS